MSLRWIVGFAEVAHLSVRVSEWVIQQRNIFLGDL